MLNEDTYKTKSKLSLLLLLLRFSQKQVSKLVDDQYLKIQRPNLNVIYSARLAVNVSWQVPCQHTFATNLAE